MICLVFLQLFILRFAVENVIPVFCWLFMFGDYQCVHADWNPNRKGLQQEIQTKGGGKANYCWKNVLILCFNKFHFFLPGHISIAQVYLGFQVKRFQLYLCSRRIKTSNAWFHSKIYDWFIHLWVWRSLQIVTKRFKGNFKTERTFLTYMDKTGLWGGRAKRGIWALWQAVWYWYEWI